MTTVSLLSTLLQDYQKSVGAIVPVPVGGIPVKSQDNNNCSACIIDLSLAAQDILAQQNVGAGNVVTLNDSQKGKLSEILEKYKDSPVNEDTLTALYNDLKAAGLTPDQLADIHQALSFNQAEVFLKLLNDDNSGDKDSSLIEGTLSALGSSASGSPIGDLQDHMLSFSQEV